MTNKEKCSNIYTIYSFESEKEFTAMGRVNEEIAFVKRVDKRSDKDMLVLVRECVQNSFSFYEKFKISPTDSGANLLIDGDAIRKEYPLIHKKVSEDEYEKIINKN